MSEVYFILRVNYEFVTYTQCCWCVMMLICDCANLIQQGYPLEALLDPWDKSLRPSLVAKVLWMLCWHFTLLPCGCTRPSCSPAIKIWWSLVLLTTAAIVHSTPLNKAALELTSAAFCAAVAEHLKLVSTRVPRALCRAMYGWCDRCSAWVALDFQHPVYGIFCWLQYRRSLLPCMHALQLVWLLAI